ncbi:MAG TPA: nucleoside hydrolase [Hyphomicrobiaceae bacterium]|nr:nucleoside hydrolase [Hyphomicrobiaceae bacterium]
MRKRMLWLVALSAASATVGLVTPLPNEPFATAAERQVSEVDLGDHFRSPEQKSLVTFVTEGGATYYVPKGAEDRLGPVVPADEFVGKHLGNGQLDTHILSDPGTDDFPAAIYIMAKKERFRLLSLTAGFGNVHPRMTLKNAKLCVALTGRLDIPVFRGAQFPLGGTLPDAAAAEHGQDGLGGARPFNFEKAVKPDLAKVTVKDDGPAFVAQDVLQRYKNGAEPVLVVSVGPLTDLYRALERVVREDPKALEKVRVSIMGGGVALKGWHTNVTPWSEFNFFQDPLAAKAAFEILEQRNVPTIIAPLDLTHQTSVSPLFGGRHLEQLAARDKNPVADMVAQLFSHVGSFDRERSMDVYGFNWRRRFMHDVNAASVLARSDLYKGFTARVRVTGEGEQRGMVTTTADLQGNAFVLVGGEPEAIVRHWLETFATYTGH